jgi:hypothetical protein
MSNFLKIPVNLCQKATQANTVWVRSYDDLRSVRLEKRNDYVLVVHIHFLSFES